MMNEEKKEIYERLIESLESISRNLDDLDSSLVSIDDKLDSIVIRLSAIEDLLDEDKPIIKKGDKKK